MRKIQKYIKGTSSVGVRNKSDNTGNSKSSVNIDVNIINQKKKKK